MSNINIIPNALLKDYTTFRIGGPCLSLIECQTPDELIQTIQKLNSENEKFILIGGGSNIVCPDKGLDCHVLRYVSDEPIVEQHTNELIVSGSTILDDLVVYALENSLTGINYCSGIPGTVGGAIVGNAGAWGKQIGDILLSATLIDKQGKIKEVQNDYFQFKYRDSFLKQSNEILVSAQLKFKSGNKVELQNERNEILNLRKEKHPDLSITPCAGSFFRNIEPTSSAGRRQAAGWFLEQAGGKDLKVGGASIFPKHANIIINEDKATAQDVFELQEKMSQAVKEKFDLDLIREVRFLTI